MIDEAPTSGDSANRIIGELGGRQRQTAERKETQPAMPALTLRTS
jgi:hypothetical protein